MRGLEPNGNLVAVGRALGERLECITFGLLTEGA
jgi:hypothetical protein